MLDEPIVALVLNLLVQSLLAIGGVSVILVELHRVIVLSGGWLTETQFTTLFALAQAAPGGAPGGRAWRPWRCAPGSSDGRLRREASTVAAR